MKIFIYLSSIYRVDSYMSINTIIHGFLLITDQDITRTHLNKAFQTSK